MKQQVSAKARYIRMSPRKVRLVIDVVRGLSVEGARKELMFMKKAAAEPVLKLINSAVANALHNHGLKKEGLKVRAITADGGPILYRYKPRAMGRAATIRKRTSHISVVLEGDKAMVEKAPTEKTTIKKKVESQVK